MKNFLKISCTACAVFLASCAVDDVTLLKEAGLHGQSKAADDYLRQANECLDTTLRLAHPQASVKQIKAAKLKILASMKSGSPLRADFEARAQRQLAQENPQSADKYLVYDSYKLVE